MIIFGLIAALTVQTAAFVAIYARTEKKAERLRDEAFWARQEARMYERALKDAWRKLYPAAAALI